MWYDNRRYGQRDGHHCVSWRRAYRSHHERTSLSNTESPRLRTGIAALEHCCMAVPSQARAKRL